MKNYYNPPDATHLSPFDKGGLFGVLIASFIKGGVGQPKAD